MYATVRIFFIRHGQLVAPYLDHLKMDYETLTGLSLSTLDLGINQNASILFERQTVGLDFSRIQTMYYNNSGKSSTRSLESAHCILSKFKEIYGNTVELRGLPEIREVNFDVSGLLNKQEFNEAGMPAIRTALYKAALYGGATEPVTDIASRIHVLHKIVEDHARKDESVLFVTHDFFMRFLEVYITRKERLDGIGVDDLNRTSLNYYFSGFKSDGALRFLEHWGN